MLAFAAQHGLGVAGYMKPNIGMINSETRYIPNFNLGGTDLLIYETAK